MIQFTIFKNLFDNKTDKTMELSDFKEFESLLYKMSRVRKRGKKDSQLISPACYKDGTNRRCNDNVSHWSKWAAMDVDDHQFDPENLRNDLIEHFGFYNFVCYSTASSTLSLPKFRMVFPLSETVDESRVRHFWYALNKELGEIGDPQTKDLSRMYYIPASYDGAYNFIFSHTGGADIDPSALIKKHEYLDTRSSSKSFIERLPPAMQKEILEHRKNSMTRKSDVYWSSYHDCPFVNPHLINDYKAIAHVDNTGRYAMIYKIMVSIATNAIRDGYAITADEIVGLIRELDMETSRRYTKRPLNVEADRALEYAYRKM